MRVLVTGAKGFVGKNLCAALRNIRDGKDRRFPELKIEEIFEYDLDSTPEELDQWCKECDFVFNLAGVNRPQNQEEFMQGNFGFASTLLDTLKNHKNTCPVMLSSSQQASLTGRFGNSEYGRSKKAGEDLFLDYERDFLKANTDCTDYTDKGLKPRVLIYRFPNLFGKWCRPNYNSAVATFCNAFANDLPYTVNDPSVELELLYIDDLVDEMIAGLQGKEHRCEFDGLEVIPTTDKTDNKESVQSESSVFNKKGQLCLKQGRYCYCPVTHKVTLGEIVELLKSFAEQPKTLMIPEIPAGSFAKKLYSTYLSYLPYEKTAFDLKMNVDERGSFTELVHTLNAGQVSINISKPGITKGQHWHNTKFEQFIVVKGHGLIQQRNLNDPEGKVLEWEVSGDHIQAVHMLPGYTHNIINLSDTEDLVTVMYCNEIFNPNKPDTFFEKVK
ncbi:NAD-dependent epimerase/dehydratase family protein [Prevotella sp. E2-28]|uniref:polysaccharide biosynthesis C-terminal domain-containing protein n=1 Tax=Prevotella sp. E2-28 TaxID=2913620 RepID=UPI001EDC0BCF|nr:NAD-dependent epimerase/dehydratase family protein [Prevotella sp. E2-28]UKK54788.1 NAD-dependent epimerase/dehydratase family protein [Prevotella sp. E2-28]